MVQQGAVGILLTDTVYGLVANSRNPSAVRRLYALKNRERKPGTSIAANVEQLRELGLRSDMLDTVRHLWPGPVSVVIEHDMDYVHQGLGDSPFRVVDQPELVTFLEKTGPLTTSSANAPGQPPAQNLAEAQAYFGDKVDFYVDGGDQPERPSSTIIKVTDEGILVIRQGAVRIVGNVAEQSQ